MRSVIILWILVYPAAVQSLVQSSLAERYYSLGGSSAFLHARGLVPSPSKKAAGEGRVSKLAGEQKSSSRSSTAASASRSAQEGMGDQRGSSDRPVSSPNTVGAGRGGGGGGGAQRSALGRVPEGGDRVVGSGKSAFSPYKPPESPSRRIPSQPPPLSRSANAAGNVRDGIGRNSGQTRTPEPPLGRSANAAGNVRDGIGRKSGHTRTPEPPLGRSANAAGNVRDGIGRNSGQKRKRGASHTAINTNNADQRSSPHKIQSDGPPYSGGTRRENTSRRIVTNQFSLPVDELDRVNSFRKFPSNKS